MAQPGPPPIPAAHPSCSDDAHFRPDGNGSSAEADQDFEHPMKIEDVRLQPALSRASCTGDVLPHSLSVRNAWTHSRGPEGAALDICRDGVRVKMPSSVIRVPCCLAHAPRAHALPSSEFAPLEIKSPMTGLLTRVHPKALPLNSHSLQRSTRCGVRRPRR